MVSFGASQSELQAILEVPKLTHAIPSTEGMSKDTKVNRTKDFMVQRAVGFLQAADATC